MDARMPENPAPGQSLTSEEQLEKLHSTIARAKEYAAEQAREADRVIRQNPYQAVGIAFGAGLLVGLLVGRK